MMVNLLKQGLYEDINNNEIQEELKDLENDKFIIDKSKIYNE